MTESLIFKSMPSLLFATTQTVVGSGRLWQWRQELAAV
jgi:hypothetical protein